MDINDERIQEALKEAPRLILKGVGLSWGQVSGEKKARWAQAMFNSLRTARTRRRIQSEDETLPENCMHRRNAVEKGLLIHF